MGEIVNLNQFRKRQARVKATAQAARNRVRHGRSAADKQRDQDAEARRTKALDGKLQADPS